MFKVQEMCHKNDMTQTRTKCIDNLYANVISLHAKLEGKVLLCLRFLVSSVITQEVSHIKFPKIM